MPKFGRFASLQAAVLPVAVALLAILVSLNDAGAQSDEETFPQFYKVMNLPVNVRSISSSKVRVLGFYESGTVLEVLEFDNSRNWARVDWQGGDGWVAKRLIRKMRVEPVIDTSFPQDITCHGADPAWQLTMTKDGAVTFVAGENEKIDGSIGWSSPSDNHGDRKVAFSTGWFTGILQRENCKDPTTQNMVPWNLEIIDTGNLQPRFRSGCCLATAQQ